MATSLISCCWYCKYGISYRDLKEMMSERGVIVDHTTLFRWVQHYAPPRRTAKSARRFLGKALRLRQRFASRFQHPHTFEYDRFILERSCSFF